MYILCDTSCILMLIRIAPYMFIDEHYRCCTIIPVRNEIFRTHKFKTKYPWRIQCKDKIQCLPNDLVNNDNVQRYFDAIDSLVDHGTINEKAGLEFDLGYVDKMILSCALANGFKITTGDDDIKDFAVQEFGADFRGWISPIGMINGWVRNGLIEWNDSLHAYLSVWKRDNEHPQPQRQKTAFKKLTGRRYPGS